MANPIAGAIKWLSRRKNREAAGAVVGVVREVFSKPKPTTFPLNGGNLTSEPSADPLPPVADIGREWDTYTLNRAAVAELRIRELEEDARHHRERAYRLEAGLRTLRYELCEEKYCACCRHFKKVILHALDGAT